MQNNIPGGRQLSENNILARISQLRMNQLYSNFYYLYKNISARLYLLERRLYRKMLQENSSQPRKNHGNDNDYYVTATKVQENFCNTRNN